MSGIEIELNDDEKYIDLFLDSFTRKLENGVKATREDLMIFSLIQKDKDSLLQTVEKNVLKTFIKALRNGTKELYVKK